MDKLDLFLLIKLNDVNVISHNLSCFDCPLCSECPKGDCAKELTKFITAIQIYEDTINNNQSSEKPLVVLGE